MSGLVQRAFARGLINPMVMGYDHFPRDLRRTLDGPKRLVGFRHDGSAPLDDAIGRVKDPSAGLSR